MMILNLNLCSSTVWSMGKEGENVKFNVILEI